MQSYWIPLIQATYISVLLQTNQNISNSFLGYDALKAVNKELIAMYWDIGKKITEKQNKLGWGKSVVESLALDLQKEFPGMQGFSSRNIWYMRNFYVEYSQNTKLQPLVAEIAWLI